MDKKKVSMLLATILLLQIIFPVFSSFLNLIPSVLATGVNYGEKVAELGYDWQTDVNWNSDEDISGEGGEVHAYILNDGITLIVIGEGKMESYGGLKDAPFDNNKYEGIQKVVFGKGIINIGNSAFCDMQDLKQVVISESITNIEGKAFSGCGNLNEIDFSYGLQNIWERAFFGCSSLKTIKLPESLLYIGHESFEACDYETIVIPNSVEYIEYYAFGQTGCFSDSFRKVKFIYQGGSYAETWLSDKGADSKIMDNEKPIIQEVKIININEENIVILVSAYDNSGYYAKNTYNFCINGSWQGWTNNSSIGVLAGTKIKIKVKDLVGNESDITEDIGRTNNYRST